MTWKIDTEGPQHPCCFDTAIIDTERTNSFGKPLRIAEFFDKADAQLVCSVINKEPRPTMVFKVEEIGYSNVGGGQSKTRYTLVGPKQGHNDDSAYSRHDEVPVFFDGGPNVKGQCIRFADYFGLEAEFVHSKEGLV